MEMKSRKSKTLVEVFAAEEVQTTATRIRLAREAAGLSQRRLAADVEMSLSHLWHIERGDHQPTLATLRKLAAAMKTSVSKLID
jgi:transcriptional regulator with XRE-family HTH domain